MSSATVLHLYIADQTWLILGQIITCRSSAEDLPTISIADCEQMTAYV